MEVSLERTRQLNLGCGRQRQEGALNVDVVGTPDLVWDLNEHPYPLPRNHFERIMARDVVEHLADVKAFVEETHALLRPGGVLEITTPHFSCANSFIDPTHRQHLSYFSFDYFTDDHQWNFYSAARFEIVERSIVFRNSLANRFVAKFARKWPERYEQRFAWMFPAWFLIFKLRAIKLAE